MKPKQSLENAVKFITALSLSNGQHTTDRDIERIKSLWHENTKFFVFINQYGINIMPLIEQSHKTGVYVCEHLKRGKVIYFHDNTFTEVTWDNWKRIYRTISRKPQTNDTEQSRSYTTSYRSKMFEDGKAERPIKKPRKRGFEKNYNAITTMNNIYIGSYLTWKHI